MVKKRKKIIRNKKRGNGETKERKKLINIIVISLTLKKMKS